jgi:hypothetical protein
MEFCPVCMLRKGLAAGDGFAILDVRLETLQPVSVGPFEAL